MSIQQGRVLGFRIRVSGTEGRARRGCQLTGKRSKVYFRRALGAWCRVRDVVHPDGLTCVEG